MVGCLPVASPFYSIYPYPLSFHPTKLPTQQIHWNAFLSPSDLPSRSCSNSQPSWCLLIAPYNSVNHSHVFHRYSKCINRSINIILYLPDSLISRNHLSHFSFVHNTLYMLGAQLIEITTICLVLCARNHISYFYRNIKHQPSKYRRNPQGYNGNPWPSQNSSPYLLNSRAFVISRTLFCLWMEKNRIKQ